MKEKVFPVGAYAANCSILWSDPAKAWIVDPGADAEQILAVLRAERLTPGMVVFTHGHFDHISGVTGLLAAYPGIPVVLHRADASFAFSALNAMPPYAPTEAPATLVTDKEDGDELACGGLTARVLHTPGHTPGGCCLYFGQEGLLVAGDTLFAGSVGRTDFPGGSWEALKRSLRMLMALPDETRVICGHGPETTMGREKQGNPYLQEVG